MFKNVFINEISDGYERILEKSVAFALFLDSFRTGDRESSFEEEVAIQEFIDIRFSGSCNGQDGSRLLFFKVDVKKSYFIAIILNERRVNRFSIVDMFSGVNSYLFNEVLKCVKQVKKSDEELSLSREDKYNFTLSGGGVDLKMDFSSLQSDHLNTD